MEQVSGVLQAWIASKEKTWGPSVLAEVRDRVKPSLRLSKEKEDSYKQLKASLPKHVSKYAPGKQVILQFNNKPDSNAARAQLLGAGIETELANEWAFRAISRDIKWGIPLPPIDPELAGKTLYVWPDSLIAPIAFSQVALTKQGRDPAQFAEFWRDPDARVFQFVGQDNVFFYVLMQGAIWLGTQADPSRLPIAGELQLTDILGCFHLLVGGQKMSKSRGTFINADQLLDEKGYTTDQVRYYLALLGLPEKSSDFDFAKLDDRNKFLAGPMNAALERPIAAAHSKFDGRVPQGVLIDDIERETVRMVQRYVRSMERAAFPNLLFELENYARSINSLFAQYKPHDDRHPLEARQNALFSAFYVLKNMMIMLYPFVPATMQRLRESLRLPEDVFKLEQLGTPIPAGHVLGDKQAYFPQV